MGDQGLSVYIAATETQRAQGLKGLEALPEGVDGMLFVFGESISATFGMKDTLMPLDIWWFDSSGLLVGTTEMEPCSSESCADYRSPGPVSWALETPAAAHEFSMGDALSTG